MSSDKTDNITPIRPDVKVKPKAKPRKWKSGARWDVLEHYYRIGWSLSDIARLPEAKGITSQAIANRVRRYNWTRNLEPRVADAARAMMVMGMGEDGKPSAETLSMLRGNKATEDQVVLSSAAQIAERLTTTRKRSKRLDSIINRLSNLIENEIEYLEAEAEERTDPNRVRVEINRLTKSIGQLVTAVSKANEEERNVHDLRRLMKPKEDIKPMIVKKRAVLDAEEVGSTDEDEAGVA